MYSFPYYLTSSPSFIEGWARILDFGDKFTGYNYAPTEKVADAMATEDDWRAVGRELEDAMNEYRNANRTRIGGGQECLP